MRAAVLTALVAAALGLAAPVTAVAARPPSPKAIARAIARAQRSSSLWATINICNSRQQRYVVGVRGQMPALGFSATLSMTIHLDAWSAQAKRFEPIDSPYAVNHVSLGSHSTGLQQGGAVFPFKKGQSGRWNATIVFTWARGGKTIGTAQRTTTGGHSDADYGSPPRY